MLDLDGMAAYFCVPDGFQNAIKPLWHFHNFLLPCNCTHAGIIRTPYGKLTTKHEEVLMLVVCLNGSRGDSSMIAAVSKELMELDKGDKHELVDVARHLVKCDYSADPAKLQIIIPIKPDFLRNFWLTKANNLFPHLAVAANKLL